MNNRYAYLGVKSEQIKTTAEEILKYKSDYILAMVPINPISTEAPKKKKNYFSIKIEAMIPEEAIVNKDAIMDFGCMVVVVLPKERVKPECLIKD